MAELVRTHPAPVWLVVAEDLTTAEHLAEDTRFFHTAAGSKTPLSVLLFPESLADRPDMREAFAASNDRLTVLSRLRALRHRTEAPDRLVVVTTPAALLQPVPALEEFATRELTLRRGQAPEAGSHDHDPAALHHRPMVPWPPGAVHGVRPTVPEARCLSCPVARCQPDAGPGGSGWQRGHQ